MEGFGNTTRISRVLRIAARKVGGPDSVHNADEAGSSQGIKRQIPFASKKALIASLRSLEVRRVVQRRDLSGQFQISMPSSICSP
jgi:hypothetical protein